jgi:calcium-dependent protein kinase
MGCALKICTKNQEDEYDKQGSSTAKTTERPIDTMFNDTARTGFSSPRGNNKISINASNIVLNKKGLPQNYYENLKFLGAGAFGKVYKVQLKGTDEIRALKAIKLTHLNQTLNISEIEQEVEILKHLDHPNIVKVYETFSDDDNYYIVGEYCSEGSLQEKLEKLNFSINEKLVRKLMAQILSAVTYLHSNNVFHGDLKLDNILIDSLTSSKETFSSALRADLKNMKLDECRFPSMANFEVKLIDFGCSKIFNKSSKFQGLIGTVQYIAPEVIKNDYTEKCDVWSCGVIMYVLLSGRYPFEGESEEEIEKSVLKGKISFNDPLFKTVSKYAKDLITYLLTYDPNKRPTSLQALKHPFFTHRLSNSIIMDRNETQLILQNLKKINSKNKFNEAVLTFITHNFSQKDEVFKLKKLFKYIDKNGDGRISKQELISAYQEMGFGITNSDIERLVDIIDSDNNGYIEYEEFIRVTINQNKILTETNLKKAFDLFDIDQSGTISCEEVKQILSSGNDLPDELFKDVFELINKTGSDEITFEEFKKLIENVEDVQDVQAVEVTNLN